MSEPWFDPGRFGAWFGAIVGGGGGALLGLLGGLMGTYLPRGRGRGAFTVALALVVVVGACCLGAGGVALWMGQPYGIWFPPVLSGLILAPIGAVQLVLVRVVARQVERRKMEASELRDL